MGDTEFFDFNLVEEMEQFNMGEHKSSYRFLGNKKVGEGIRFSVWAPHALRVSLIGDFNGWNEENMVQVYETGTWTCVSKHAKEGDCYKYRIYDKSEQAVDKIDPYAMKFEVPPKDASIVYEFHHMEWDDDAWLNDRKQRDHIKEALNIYEVHTTSWKRHPGGRPYSFYDLAQTLIPYVKKMNYTHIEFMPVMDHPLDASWGYQITGYYAVAGRFGDLEGFAYFVNEAHKQRVGVILDWVPSHFCKNANALAYYDGTPTYEYQNAWQANNNRWGTLNFDLGKNQVKSFLISNAMFWIKEMHVDGLRIDAVSNMIYRDYDDGEWVPNEDGSNHNRVGISFLQELNAKIHHQNLGVMMIAEESTAWADVTRTTGLSALGFDYKWNMGWMNDTLNYFAQDSYHRNQNFHLINFNFVYMQDEHFILALSHDEVVHGKKSLLGRVDGSREQQFEQLRLLYAYMFTMPGKKLNFMGNEIGQFLEWRFHEQVEWDVLNLPFNYEYQHFVKTMNQLYLDQRALYEKDYEVDGVEVLDGDAPFVILKRQGKQEKDFLICIHNFSHDQQNNVKVKVDYPGAYEVILNSALKEFGGYWCYDHPLLFSKEKKESTVNEIHLVVPAMASIIIKPNKI